MSSQTVSLRIEIPQAEIVLLRRTLQLSRNRHRDPLNMIRDTAIDAAKGLAGSTVECRNWKQLQALARRLGVESAV